MFLGDKLIGPAISTLCRDFVMGEVDATLLLNRMGNLRPLASPKSTLGVGQANEKI